MLQPSAFQATKSTKRLPLNVPAGMTGADGVLVLNCRTISAGAGRLPGHEQSHPNARVRLCRTAGRDFENAMAEQDPLTTVERNFIEHWSRRRWQLLRSWIATGAILWGGFMAYFTLHDSYAEGRLSTAALVLFVALLLLGGCVFGVGMWAFGEFRFRRMLAKGGGNRSSKAD
jgi:hypothetical protein